MLRITQQDSAKDAKRYYASADYYSEEIVGLWGGEGARRLGLEGMVDKVFIGQSSQSFPASNRRQFYVSVSRGRQQAVVFTDNKKELLKTVKRADEPMSALELAAAPRVKLPLRMRLKKHLAFMRRMGNVAPVKARHQAGPDRAQTLQREVSHER